MHLLIEKPLALDPAGCDEVRSAVAAAGVVAAVSHAERFHPAAQALRHQSRGGTVGTLSEVATCNERGWPRNDIGGVALDLGTHDLVLVPWITGRRYAPVSMGVAPLHDAPLAHAVSVTAILPGPLRVTHRWSWLSPGRHREIVIRGEQGEIRADLASSLPGLDPLAAQFRAVLDVVRGRLDPEAPFAPVSLADAAWAVSLAHAVLRGAGDSRF